MQSAQPINQVNERPVVVYAAQQKQGIVPSHEMKWGGSHRLSYWHLQALARSGVDLHVVVTNDSKLDLPDAEVMLTRTPGILSLPVAEHEEAQRTWREDLLRVIDRTDPDIIFLQGPDFETLQAIPAHMTNRLVFASHYHFRTQPERREWLEAHPEVTITAVSDAHISVMGKLINQAVVARAGIPVEAHRLRRSPTRPTAPSLDAVAEAFDASGGRLLSQVDRLSPDKSPLAAAKAFMSSDLPSKGWRLVLAGNEFLAGTPSSSTADDPNIAYHEALLSFVQTEGRDRIVLLGPLSGADVDEVYGASVAMLALGGVDTPGHREAYGLSTAISQAVGTPVLGATALDRSMIEEGVSGWWYEPSSSLPERLNEIGRDHGSVDRSGVRRWAQQNQNLGQMFVTYGELITKAAAARGKEWSLTPERLSAGLKATVDSARVPSGSRTDPSPRL